MARSTKLANASATTAANAVVDQADGGKLRIYTGSQPVNPATAASGTLLVEATLGTPAFGAASNGVATANAIANAVITNTGAPGWYRILASNGTTVLWDGSVGTISGSFDMVIGASTITAAGELAVNSLTYTQPTA